MMILEGIVIGLILIAAPQEGDFTSEDCLDCHEISIGGSVHEGLECMDCHEGIKELPHETLLPSVNCGSCHDDISMEHRISIHGRAIKAGIKEAAHCWDCHGSHNILPPSDKRSRTYPLNLPATCGKCHGEPDLAKKFGIPVENPYQMYTHSIHYQALLKNLPAATCSDCHGVHNILELSDPGSPINKRNVAKTCSQCHTQAYKDYTHSIHFTALKQGILDAPTCTDCHAEHRILSPKNPKSPVYTYNVPKTCGACHENYVLSEKYGIPGLRLSSYFKSFHGVALEAGRITAANCVSCHENHHILPSSDPESPVNVANLDKTCGKCHPGIQVKPTEFTVHQVVGTLSHRITGIIRAIYLWIIGLTIGGMLIYVFTDWLYKVRHPAIALDLPENPNKFNSFERKLHLFHLISFFILAYTGFAHHYPDTFLTMWISKIYGGVIRAYLHRIAGVVLIVVFVLQGYLAFFTKRGRSQIKALLPHLSDIKYAISIFLRNIGLMQKGPSPPTGFNFYEKFEYWAFIWGSGIMAITGLLLWFTTQTLSLFPKWVLDASAVIHFYEAILATLAIIIWHLYWVIFDPAVYPLNWSMFRGEPPTHEKTIRVH